MNKRLPIVMIMVALAAAGCFHNRPDYPAAWPTQRASGADIETSIQGTYECRGEAKTGNADATTTTISGVFFEGKDLARTTSCDAFSITKDQPGILIISVFSNGKEVGKRILRMDKDYATEGDWLHLRRRGGFKSGDNIVGFGSGRESLTTNNESDLIIKSDGWFMAVVLLVPVAGSDAVWVRFKRTEPVTSDAKKGWDVQAK